MRVAVLLGAVVCACGGGGNNGDSGAADGASDVTQMDAASDVISDTSNPDSGPGATSILLFGGSTDCSGNTPVPVLGDAWSWDGTKWTSVTPAGPSARYEHTSATAHGSTVVFAGFDANDGFLADSWAFNGTTWSSVSGSPGTRAFTAMASTGNSAILFGGCTSCFSGTGLADTWVWNRMEHGADGGAHRA